MISNTHRWLAAGLLIAGLAAVPTAVQAQAQVPAWPTLERQLREARVVPGSALERLIADNQDFDLLRPDEAKDLLPLPLWLRVLWRKQHPELRVPPHDPTGGYPLVLREVHGWLLAHQDLLPGLPEEDVLPPLKAASIGTNLRISGAQTSPRSESDVRINFWNPSRVISASNNISGSGVQAQFYSSDGGATWGQTTLSLTTGDAFHSDPTVDWTSDGTAWSATLGIDAFVTVLKLRLYKSTTGGATWSFDSTGSGTQTAVDKEMLWVDHSATSAFKDYLYAIWHNGAPVFMNRRNGPAGTWGTPIQVSGAETTGTGIGGDVKTNANGDVFGFWPDTGSRRLLVVKSTNGGTSYSTPTTIATTFDSYDIGVPSFNSRRALIYVSGGAYRTATKDLVFASWTDLTGATGCTSAANEPGSNTASTCKTRIWFSRSTNGGASWSAPVMLNNQASLNDQYNQWLAVDPTTGALGIMYYDTVGDAGRKKTDVWYQSSFDDGATWSAAVKVTTAMTDETVAGSDSGNQYGDYNGLTSYAGVLFPTWTDRRSGAREEIWTAKIQDACAPAAPTGLTATAVGSGRIDLSWNAVSGAAGYHVLRATTSGGPYTQIAAPTGTTYSDTGVTNGTTYYYVVRAFNGGCESGNSNQASATAGATYACTVDVVGGTNSCAGAITLVSSTGSQRVLKVNMAGGYVRMDVFADVCSPTGIPVHLADSPTDNGFGGDSGTTNHDAETYLYYNRFDFFDDDFGDAYTVERDVIPATGCSRVQWSLMENSILFDNDADPADAAKINVDSYEGFELAPYAETDAEDPTGADANFWYAGLNQTVDGFRLGTGLNKACFVLSTTTTPAPATLSSLCP